MTGALTTFALLALICSSRLAECQSVHSNHIYDFRTTSNFTLYWNVPTFQCRSHKVYFTGLAAKYGFVQNANDNFRGEKVVILYDPGAFPAILENSNSVLYRNGGVPQLGDLNFHLQTYEDVINQLIPDKNFSGIAVIDFESWRPVFRQNWGALLPYKDRSYEIERARHPAWTNNQIIKEATKNFEAAGRPYVEDTILLSKQLRPLAKWGYYAYPYCFNMGGNNMGITHCAQDVQDENDDIHWMFSSSDMLNPSLYFPEVRLNAAERIQMIEGRIVEAQRINQNLNLPILPYYWFKYQDTNNFVAQTDLHASFDKLKQLGADGIILWGASNDVNSKAKCEALYDYIDNILGPTWLNFA